MVVPGVRRGGAVTLDAYLDRWLAVQVRPTLAPRTAETYDERLRLYVRPELGHVELEALTPMVIQEAYAAMLARGVTPMCVRLGHYALHNALRRAVRWGLLASNPTEEVTPSRPRRRPPRATLEREHLPAFLGAAQAYPGWQGTACLILLGTGLRPGECLGLQWSDLTWDEPATATVERSLWWPRHGQEWVLRPPKTEAGHRTVLVPAPVAEALRRHRDGAAAEDLVFRRHDGEPCRGRQLRAGLRAILARAGLDLPLCPYGLRHSYATLALEAGVEVEYVAEAMGHSSVAITLDTYVRRRPRRRLEALLRYTGYVWDPGAPDSKR